MKLGQGSGPVTYYQPEIQSYQGYYAFGMLLPNRQLSPANYRYGFNGKENDNEVEGTGKYLGISPYSTGLDNPLIFRDDNGKWIVGKNGKAVTYSIEDGQIKWSSNVTDDVKKLGQAMLKTAKGTEMLNFFINAPTKFHIKISTHEDVHGQYAESTPVKDNKGEREMTPGDDGKSYYKEVNTVINLNAITATTENRFADKDGKVDVTEGLNPVGVVEASHAIPEQIITEKPMVQSDYFQSSSNFVIIYNPIENNEIKTRVQYRSQNGGAINEDLFAPYEKVGNTIDPKSKTPN